MNLKISAYFSFLFYFIFCVISFDLRIYKTTHTSKVLKFYV